MVCGDCCTTVICEPDLQIAGSLCLGTQCLNRRHHIGGLRVVCLSERRGPAEVLRQVVEDGRKLRERFHAGIPLLFIDGLIQRCACQILVLLKPADGGSNLVGEGCGSKNLGNERVRVERDGRHQLLQIVRREGRAFSRISVVSSCCAAPVPVPVAGLPLQRARR